MLMPLILFAAAVMAAFFIHEAGHFFAALYFGHMLRFRFGWGKLGEIPIPRGIWYMPSDTEAHRRIIAIAGFGAELLSAPLLYLIGLTPYPLIAVVHLLVYPLYADGVSDFRWFDDGFLSISKRGWIWIYIMASCAVFWWGIYKIIMLVW